MVRPPCCDKPNVRRGLWTAEEDAKMLAYVSKHGTGNWTNVPKKAGLRRCGKSCRLRWTNYLRPDLKHEGFTPHEEELIVKLHATLGSRWAIIAQQLPGRTDNDVKNYWNTKLKKKLTEMGIDPVTHKPFSQILADYGNIGGLPKSGNRISSFNRDLKNAFIAKPADQYPSPAEANPDISGHLMTPKLEQFQERFLNSTDNHNHSLDLLEQLQAIKLVTEASHCTKYEPPTSPHFLNEGSFSSSATSSSSSTCSTAAQAKSPLSFSWQDFLLEDALLPTDPLDQTVELPSQEEFTSQTQNFTPPPQGQQVRADQGMEMAAFPSSSNGNQVQYPSHSSFIEDILDTENETFMAFPDILEEPFYY